MCALVFLKSPVTGSCFPRVHVNVAALEVRLQNVLVPLEGSSLVTMPLLQLSVQQHLRDSVILHTDDVSCPSQLALDDQALNAGKAALLQDLEVGHSVLLLDVADLPQTSLMKLLQLLNVPAVGGPRLAAIQKRAQDHSSVHGNLGGEADAAVFGLFVSRPKAALAFPMRCITSASRDQLLVTVLPR